MGILAQLGHAKHQATPWWTRTEVADVSLSLDLFAPENTDVPWY